MSMAAGSQYFANLPQPSSSVGCAKLKTVPIVFVPPLSGQVGLSASEHYDADRLVGPVTSSTASVGESSMEKDSNVASNGWLKVASFIIVISISIIGYLLVDAKNEMSASIDKLSTLAVKASSDISDIKVQGAVLNGRIDVANSKLDGIDKAVASIADDVRQIRNKQ